MRPIIKEDASIDSRMTKAADEIVSKEPEKWVEAAEDLRDLVAAQRNGMSRLKEKITEAADAKVKAAERMAGILKRGPGFDPNEEDKVFMMFKTRRIARLLEKKVRTSDMEIARKKG